MLPVVLSLLFLLQRGPAGPQTVITGQIQAPDGTAASAVTVSASVAPPPNARPEEGLQYYEELPPVATSFSDSEGRYRLAVPPGRYYVIAGAQGQGTFYPGTPDRDRATIVTVAAGSTAATLDFKLAIALGGKVSGRITPPPATGAKELAVLSGVKLESILEAPIRADGTFEFGHLPKGRYLLGVAPEPPGMPAIAFDVGDQDVTTLRFARPELHRVSGRIVTERGPLPWAFLAFTTPTTYVSAPINPDGTFTAMLHSARHVAELGGMPVGYAIASVREGSTDVTDGLAVGDRDVSGVVITVATPKQLPRVHGRIDAAKGSPKVQMTGPIIGVLETPLEPDGSFTFPAVTPGHYTLTVPGNAQVAPISVVVTYSDVEVR
jgi:hypothetical protein